MFSTISINDRVFLFRSVQACADAYLTPCIKRYVTGFMSGFKNGIEVTKTSFLPVTNELIQRPAVRHLS